MNERHFRCRSYLTALTQQRPEIKSPAADHSVFLTNVGLKRPPGGLGIRSPDNNGFANARGRDIQTLSGFGRQ